MNVTLPLALFAGFVSFVSPCFLPVVPAFVGQLVGVADDKIPTRNAVANSLGFVGGFSLVFIGLWAGIGAIGNVLGQYSTVLRILGGAILILMGLHVARLINISFLDRVVRAPMRKGKPGIGRAALLGVVFGAGWTPCVGPVLGGIIALAATSETTLSGLALMIAYCLGLGVPIVLVAVGAVNVIDRFGWFKTHSVAISLISGALLICVGLLMVFGVLQKFASMLLPV
ncbi:cytochrome c biogenesis protein CcdA [Propionimicrobium lymphophilum]|uniref:Cytochrome C biogenesis protein transmembrane domain-containing protein n=1 Tax=Propionimicrobium lymphophilum ACS-093-V-SCH5 TaxID=883161 RepID=S2WKR5_9ACTN|nr:cytochrome c biogenesis protein CcdA [Propionimicrobium lymphophilum]EPD33242.1 hypothetical protein HMPREF9306_00774 [Propionimicrobium lymphophilum ACS-093-V-SCH5]MDK7710026.1 cytochrome c biogenesis protein CcdA [Propionimicrobium lymphophilum]MDK7732725.1 cytochrome c biogenesis protein CcdA [Propionimicrobium lymphophilum]